MMELYDYQRTAVDHLQNNRRAGLFLDMGLGKTAITLSALTPEHLPALVVAPKRVAEEVWPEEQPLWRPDLSLALAAGPARRRADALARQADITVIGRDNIADAVPLAGRYQTLVLDELSGFKSRASQRWKRAKKIADKTRYIWGLTGTPSPNSLLDLWSQLYLLDSGVRLGMTIGGFRNRYFMPGRQLANGVIAEWLIRPGAERRIHELIDDICLSMSTEGRVDLPPVTFNQVKVALPTKARKQYDALKDDLVTSVEVLGSVTAANAAVLSGKLSQISAGFIYEDDETGRYETLHDEKIKAVQEIVEGTGSPVLVFYRFRPELEALRKLFPKAKQATEPGVIQQWNRGKVPVLLAHPASAGHGLNLQHGGHTCVWTSLPWSLELWEQANKRLARNGQENPVVIHVITATNTVDQGIWRALADKKKVQDALLDHLEVR